MALHEQGLDGSSKANESKKATVQTNNTQNATSETHQEHKKATLAEKDKHHKKHNKGHKKKHHKDKKHKKEHKTEKPEVAPATPAHQSIAQKNSTTAANVTANVTKNATKTVNETQNVTKASNESKYKLADEFVKEYSGANATGAANKTLVAQAKKLEGAYNQEDMFSEEQNEDAEIMKSIAYAEKKIGAKMNTPKKVRDPDQPNAPVKYDIENVSTHIDFQNLNSDGSPATESNRTA